MTDKDTYQYQDDDAVKSSSYEDYIEDSASSGPKSILNNPKFIGLASVVIGVYLLGYLVSMFYETKPSKPMVQQALVQPKNEQLDQISNTLAKQQSTIQQLSSANQQLNVAINDLRKQVTTIRNSQNSNSNTSGVEKDDLDRLSNQLADLRDRVILTENKLKSMQPKPAKKPLATYFLRGVIEGRAWVEDLRGRNTSVRVGDSLPDYGKITGIFPESGYLTTESKRRITFTKGDS